MTLTPKNYNAATARSLTIHSPAKCFWAIDPTDDFKRKYVLPNGGRLGLIKKDIGIRKAESRGWDLENTNYGHSLSLTDRFINNASFVDVLNHFTALQPTISDTTPCAGHGYYGTKDSFTILESLAFFLSHHFQLHLDQSFLNELPPGVRAIISGVQLRLDQGLEGPDAVGVLQ